MTPWTLDFESLAWQWWWWISEATWQSTLLATALLTLALLARRWPSPVRHGLLILALVKFAVPPMWVAPTGLFPWLAESLPVVAEVGSTGSAALSGSTVDTALLPEVASGSVSVLPTAEPTARNWRGGLMLLHFLGMALTLLFIAHQYRLLRRLVGSAHPVDTARLGADPLALATRLGLRRMPRVLSSPQCPTPSAFGLLRPTILLPEAMLESDDSEALEVTLAHEMAHLRRGDPWINALQIALLAVWWWNPVYHLLSRSVRRFREDCCDDLLLAAGITDGRRYCDVLLRLADHLAAPRSAPAPLPSPALGLSEQLHPLGHRLRRLMDLSLGRAAGLSGPITVLLLGLALVLLPGRAAIGGGNGPESENERWSSPVEILQVARSEVRQLWPSAILRTLVSAGDDLRFDRFELDAGGLHMSGRVTEVRTLADRMDRLGDVAFTHADLRRVLRVDDGNFEFELRVDRLDPDLTGVPGGALSPAPWRQRPASEGLQRRTLTELRGIMADDTVRLERFVPEPMAEGGWPIVAHFSTDDAGFSAYLRSMATSAQPMVFDRLIVERQQEGELKAEARILVPSRLGELGGNGEKVPMDPDTLRWQLHELYGVSEGGG